MHAVVRRGAAVRGAHEDEHRLLDEPRVVGVGAGPFGAQVDSAGELANEVAASVVAGRAAVADRREEEIDVAVDDDEAAPVEPVCPWREAAGEVRV